jgi:hypothetical protein
MLLKNLIAIALVATSTGVMADSDTRVYGSVVIADPNFSIAIGSGYPYVGPYYWAPPPVVPYYYPPKYYYKHDHHYPYPYPYRYWNYRGDYWNDGHGGRGYPPPPRSGGGGRPPPTGHGGWGNPPPPGHGGRP